MKDQYDEPILVDVAPGKNEIPADQIEAEIRTICWEQPFAVLATQGEGQPYTSLISFAASDDLKHLVFATPVQTRKYSLLISNQKVALLIDNRSKQPASINSLGAVTITGNARDVSASGEAPVWRQILITRHSYLEKFIESSSSRLILIEAERFFYVRRFQEVFQWSPGKPV